MMSSVPTSGTFQFQNSTIKAPWASTEGVTFVHPPPGDGGQEVLQRSDRPLGRHSVRHQDGVVQIDVKHQLPSPRRIHWRQPPRDIPITDVYITCQIKRPPGAVDPVMFVHLRVAVVTEVLHGSEVTKIKGYG